MSRLRAGAPLLALLAACGTIQGAGKGDVVPEAVFDRIELPPPPPLPPRNTSSSLPPEASERVDLLAPGLLLTVHVSGEPAFGIQRTRVGPNGSVFLPFLGEVSTTGLTTETLSKALSELLVTRGYLRRAQVHVAVLEESGRKIYVLGRVTRPGAYDLPFGRTLTLTQAVALAGGLSTMRTDLEADPSSIRLIREESGLRQTYRISFLEIVNQGRLEADVTLRDGDVVYVPPKQELFIFGAVNRSGGFPLADGSRLGVEEALGLAGGLNDQADPENILLIRRSSTGGESYRIPADRKDRLQTQIAASDTIIVSSRSVSRVYVLGSVNKQGGITLEPGLTVTKALALAGGTSRVASANAVKLIRASKQGEKRVYSVPVADIIANGDLEKDPLLLPGDIIWVPEGIF